MYPQCQKSSPFSMLSITSRVVSSASLHSPCRQYSAYDSQIGIMPLGTSAKQLLLRESRARPLRDLQIVSSFSRPFDSFVSDTFSIKPRTVAFQRSYVSSLSSPAGKFECVGELSESREARTRAESGRASKRSTVNKRYEGCAGGGDV